MNVAVYNMPMIYFLLRVFLSHLALGVFTFSNHAIARQPFLFMRGTPEAISGAPTSTPTPTPPPGGSINIVNTYIGGSGPSASLGGGTSAPPTPSIGNTVIVAYGGYDPATTVTLSFCGVTLTEVTKGTSSASRAHLYKGVCASTDKVFTISQSQSDVFNFLILEIENLNGNTNVVSTPNTGGGWTMTTNNITTNVADTIVVAAGTIAKGTTTYTSGPSNGFTSQGAITAGSGGTLSSLFIATKIISSTGTYTTSWTTGSGGSPDSVMVGAAFD